MLRGPVFAIVVLLARPIPPQLEKNWIPPVASVPDSMNLTVGSEPANRVVGSEATYFRTLTQSNCSVCVVLSFQIISLSDAVGTLVAVLPICVASWKKRTLVVPSRLNA